MKHATAGQAAVLSRLGSAMELDPEGSESMLCEIAVIHG